MGRILLWLLLLVIGLVVGYWYATTRCPPVPPLGYQAIPPHSPSYRILWRLAVETG